MDDNVMGYYESLFLKMLGDDISREEYNELEQWFYRSPRNGEVLLDLYRAHYALQAAKRGRRTDPAAALRHLNGKIHARRKRKRTRIAVGIAASAAIIAGVFSLMVVDRDGGSQVVSQNETGIDQVTLVFPDNRTLTFEGKEPAIGYDEHGNLISDGLRQTVPAAGDVADAGVTVQLIVPKGKRSSMTLPDGTTMWINSDSRLAFPSQFGQSREISVDGEIYLKVKRDESKPFVVHTKNFDVTVLGTSFNVRAYDGNGSQSVTLLDGSVNVAAASDKTGRILVPSQMLTYENGGMRVENVDPADHVSWITGVYRFSSERLNEIADRLENYYGTPVVFASESLASKRFSGKLEFSESADFVYESLARAASLEWVNHGDRIEFRE